MSLSEARRGKMSSESSKQWYQTNKETLSANRKNRYATDAEYREACLERSRKRQAAKLQPVADGYTISFESAAERLGVTIGVLRDWRRQHYFPEPRSRTGRLWFTENQIQLMRQLKQLDVNHCTGWKKRNRKRKELSGFFASNWYA